MDERVATLLLPLIPAAFLYLLLVMPLEFVRGSVTVRTKRRLARGALAAGIALVRVLDPLFVHARQDGPGASPGVHAPA